MLELLAGSVMEGCSLTLTLTFWSKPSIWFSSSMRIRCTSLHNRTSSHETTEGNVHTCYPLRLKAACLQSSLDSDWQSQLSGNRGTFVE